MMKRKPAPASNPPIPLVTPEQKALIDERGLLEAELAPVMAILKPRMDRAKALDTIIRGWCFGLSGEISSMFVGETHCAVVGMAGEQTRIQDMAPVFVTLGRKRFLELCSMTLEKLEGAVTPEKFDELTVKERTGSRKIYVVTKPKP